MKYISKKYILFVFALGLGFSGYADTIVHGTHSHSRQRSLRKSLELSHNKHLRIKGSGSFERDSFDSGSRWKTVMKVSRGGKLFVGSPDDTTNSEFRISAQTLLIIEDGGKLHVDNGSSLVVEGGGGIIIESGAEVELSGTQALLLEPEVEACLSAFAVGLDLSVLAMPPGTGDPIPIEDCQPIDPPTPPNPPTPPTDPYPSLVLENDLEYVNSLQGIVGTTLSGALTYQIPILLPVGTAGMQPQLAIVYNSQNSVSGILGAGFGLSGLSAVSRVGKDFYHDGERTGVELTPEDRFALDGNRLIQINGSAYYDTEFASFSEIEYYGSNQGFQVRAKDGSTADYGRTPDSKAVSQWLINETRDANGNFIEYEYHPNASSFASQIKEIRYTGNASAGLYPYNKITFSYINKPIQRKLYVAGQELTDGKFLSEMACFSNGILVKKYTFHYTTDKKRLVFMREHNGNGRILGELKFEWKENPHSFKNEAFWTNWFNSASHGWSTVGHPRMLADVTGDGKADMVGFSNQAFEVAESSGSGVSAIDWWWSQGTYTNNGGWNRTEHSRHVTDINGDGMADVVGFWNTGVLASLSNGTNALFWPSQWSYSFSSSGGWTNVEGQPRHLADFNGDGLPDIIGHGKTSTMVAINNRTEFNTPFSKPVFSTSDYNFGNKGSISLVGDINGDGRADIVVLKGFRTPLLPSCYSAYYAISNGTSLSDSKFAFDTPKISGNSRFNTFLQDVNGDGKADLIFTGTDGLYVALATGNGFIGPVKWTVNYSIFSNYGSKNKKHTLMIVDVNGDGLADVLAFDGSNVKISLSTGSGFAAEENWTPNFTYWGSDQSRWGNSNNFRTIADMNGDGLPDLVGFASDGVYVSLNQANDHPQLLRVIDNLGDQFTAQYDVLSNSEIYTKGPALVFPLMSFQGPLQVCKQLKTRANNKTYFYEGAIIHQQGRGFLGFSKITETDSYLQVKQVSEFELNKTYCVNLPKRTSLYALDNGAFLSGSSQVNEVQNLGQKRIYCKVPFVQKSDGLVSVLHETVFTYDNWGNVSSSITKTYREGVLLTGDPGFSVTETHNSYTSKANRPSDNRLETTESYSYNTATPNDKYPRKQHFSYDPKGNLTQKIDRYGTAIATTTNYDVNAYGLVTKISTSAPGISYPSVQELGYDDKFRFQASINIPGLGTASKTYNIWGQTLTETAIGGQITTYTYDDFGRLKKMASPEGFVTTYTIQRERNMPNAVYSSLVERSGRPYVKTYLDILGRTVKTETSNFSGVVITETSYNGKGQLEHISIPRFSDEAAKWKTYVYDYAGRLKSESFQGLTTTYDYTPMSGPHDNVLTTSVTTPNGQTSSKVYNKAGDLVSATDNGGSITYDYFVPGYVSHITSPGDAVTTITYDDYGRQTSIADPNAGTIRYEYDAFDRITKQIDAKNCTTVNKYDDFGRLEQVTEAGNRITTYTYYTTSDAKKGQLKTISCNNSTRQTYEYDNFGRITQLDESGLLTKYSYDNNGNLATYEYPSGYKIKYVYDANGYQKEILNNYTDALIWKLSSVNAAGQELSSMVCSLAKNQTYDPFGRPLTKTVAGLMNYTYGYDNLTGNMLSRSNTYNGQNETFGYDNLNRLTSGVYYHNNGNISTKSGVGAYSYDPIRKHAVKNISPELTAGCNHSIEYTSFGKAENIINSGGNMSTIFAYGPTHQRQSMSASAAGQYIVRYYAQNHESTNRPGGASAYKDYIYSPYGLVAINNSGILAPVATDHLGSIVAEYNPRKNTYEHFGYDAWGRRYRYESNGTKFYFDENPPGTNSNTELIDYFTRGYTGHEHLDMFGLINMNGRMYDPVIGRMLSPDPYVPDGAYSQDFNRYSYARNNPLSYTDPTGEFITWSIGKGRFSIGFNLTPIGIPLGAGINIGWSNGGSAGVYGEVGYRVGGTGLGAGATISHSLDYGFNSNSWSNTTSAGVYASYGWFNAGGNVSYLHGNQGGWSWGVNAGVGYGNDKWGVGLTIGYGSDGWNWGLGGYFDPPRPKVYKSPVSDNYGSQNGECVLRCLEEFSNSYGMSEYDYNYWLEQNENTLGVHPSKVKGLIDGSGAFGSEGIMPQVNDIVTAFKADQRVLMGFATDNGGGHAVMVSKVKVWDSGRYRVYFSETSPVRLAPYSTSNLFRLQGARFWTFSLKR